MKETVEIVASIITLALIFLGLPSQIIRIHKKKNTDGISFIFFSMSFLTWISWCFYGYVNNSLFMTIAQGLGGLMTTIILIQFFIYKKNLPLDQLEKEIWEQIIQDDLKRHLDDDKNSNDRGTNDDENRWEDEGGPARK